MKQGVMDVDVPAATQRSRARALVLWCPDWPVVAGIRQAGTSPQEPAAVFRENRISVCNASARAHGVRVGMRRREAQSRCPALVVLPDDPDRDARLFDPVVDAVERLAPGVEILRPGMVACRIRGPARYFGSEDSAAERIIDAVEMQDVECSVGIADVLSVAVLAARHAAIVPPGGDADFCASLPIGELARDPAIAPPGCRPLADLLVRLGIATVGAFAALPQRKVAARFGSDGIAMHRLASGCSDRNLSRRAVVADLSVEHRCDPPLERVDTAAFVARFVAERLHERLAGAGLVCSRLGIVVSTRGGRTINRVWRCVRPLTATMIADRLRWQLDGWLSHHKLQAPVDAHTGVPEYDWPPDAIAIVRLEPVEVADAGLVQYGLWGADGHREHRAGAAISRVQGLLGPGSVLSAALSGGRGPRDRVVLADWGEEKEALRDERAPWPGALPAPAPACTPPSDAGHASRTIVTVVDGGGDPVDVTGRGMLTGEPVAVGSGTMTPVRSWAGPWLIDERWWDERPGPHRRRRARMQVLPASGPPILLELDDRGWRIEAVYD